MHSVSLLAVGVVTLLGGQLGRAQQVGAVAFETASIRPAKVVPGCFSMTPPGSSYYAMTCVSLRNLIEMAYETRYIEGKDGVLDAYYDLQATLPDERPWTMDSARPMLQTLLTERFHLAFHARKREIPGFELIVAKSGTKLHPVAPATVVQGQKPGEVSQNFTMPGHIQGRGVDMATLANLLSFTAGGPVVDHSGVTGVFNVDLSYAPDNKTDSGLPSFFTAVEEQLGLKLRSEKVIVDTVVIDQADATPTPN